MIFPIVRILTDAAWMKFFETCFLSTPVFTYDIEMPVILTFFSTRDLYSRCAIHTQSNWLLRDFFQMVQSRENGKIRLKEIMTV